jgi:hypothetical protein
MLFPLAMFPQPLRLLRDAPQDFGRSRTVDAYKAR